MKLSLTRPQRAMLLFLSAAGYTAWFSGVGERGEAQDFATQSPAGMTIAQRHLPPHVANVIVRDPFSGKPVAASNAASTPVRSETGRAATASGPASSGASSSGGSGTVPNIGADPHVAADASQSTLTLALRATIVGPSPVAYVENGTAMDIVRVGDMLGDRRVARIDLRGITFTDGSRLDLPGTYLATSEPVRSAAAAARPLTINDLRRLLLPPPQASAAQSAGASTPQPASTTSYPTPGPLPTVNTQGLPVGVNPTPNPYNPTPYPYPYPYAPPR